MNFTNCLSLGRLLLTPFFIACVIYYTPQKEYLRYSALILFCLGVISDLLDGFLARRWKEETKLGAIIDPIADKVLLIGAFVTLSVSASIPAAYRIPGWVLYIVAAKDLIVVTGSGILYIILKNIEIVPSYIGKLTTFFQMMTVISVLIFFKYAYIVWTVAAALTVMTCINYALRGVKILNGARR